MRRPAWTRLICALELRKDSEVIHTYTQDPRRVLVFMLYKVSRDARHSMYAVGYKQTTAS